MFRRRGSDDPDRPVRFCREIRVHERERDAGPVCVLGAGTTGRGIAHACLVASRKVRLRETDTDALEDAVEEVRDRLDDDVDRGDLDEEAADAFARLTATDDVATAADGAAVVVETVPEGLDLKRAALSEAEAHAPEERCWRRTPRRFH